MRDNIENLKNKKMNNFTHLHVHTEYSIGDAISQIPALIDKAIADGMEAMAITDQSNMFGVKHFFDYAKSVSQKTGKPFKPIIGCEVDMIPISRFEKKVKEKHPGFHLILLAKNKTGYHNLMKIVSLGYLEGFYYKPRINKEILEKYREGLIVTTACVAGEVPQLILNGKISEAEDTIIWFKERFADDFYIELQRHKTDKPNTAIYIFQQQEVVNPIMVELAQKHGVKCIATNDVFFVNENEACPHPAEKIAKIKDDFIKGATDKGYDAKICCKIWKEWEEFGCYLFNKSHAVCYTWIAYQTAYLKANFPSEYMEACEKWRS